MKIDISKYYIKSKQDGLFVGECLGLGFFESHMETGEISKIEKPIPFNSIEEAQTFLDSWVGGPSDCFVIYGEEV